MPLSHTASQMLVILNNVDELIKRSNERQKAQDVIRALSVYAKSKNFAIPHDKIDNFCSVLIDSRPATLSFLIKDIVRDILTADKKNETQSRVNRIKRDIKKTQEVS